MDPVIETSGLTRQFGPIRAVDGLDLAVGAGEMFALVGPDGAGKTTTIRMLCGILKPTAGSVRVLGRDLVNEAALIKNDIGYLSQRFSLYGDLTVDENIEFFAEIQGQGLQETARRAPRLHSPGALPHAPGRASVGRHEAEAGPGLHSHPYAPSTPPRRADDGGRPGLAPGLLEDPFESPQDRDHHFHVDALPR